jgi:opacity protein-like surface antigen
VHWFDWFHKEGIAMLKLRKQILNLATLTVLTLPCTAFAGEWKYAASFYLFTPETTTAIGGVEATLSFSDALDNLDMAFMAAFEANNGRWGVIADYMLTDLSFGNPTPGPAFSGVNASLKTQIFNGYATYRAYQNPKVTLDIAAGIRWFNTTTDITLLPGILPGGTSRADEDWVDPVIGIRARFEMSEKLSGTVFADYGGFRSGSESWQTLLTLDYNINENWVARAGYRYISIDHTINGMDFSFKQSGPIFGATYRF